MTCFAASYLVALLVELTRPLFRLRFRTLFALGMASAGLFAQAVYLYQQIQRDAGTGALLFSWYHWLLLASWLVAAAYVTFAVSRPSTTVGVFFLPLVLALTLGAIPLRGRAPFPADAGYVYWASVHGFLLLAGTVVVTLGFASGLMFWVSSHRLKRHIPPQQGLRLPSLETLQRINRTSVLVSTGLLAAGLLTGVLLNVAKGAFPWSDPVILTSAGLIAWLAAAAVLELFVPAARQGRKVVYLTVATFVFLVVAMGVALLGPTSHAAAENPNIEIRNPKQMRSTNGRNPKPRPPSIGAVSGSVSSIRISDFKFVSDFDIRISDFLRRRPP